MNDDEFLSFVGKYILLPFFICYLLAVEYLFVGGLYRQAITTIIIVFSINAIVFYRKDTERGTI